MHASSDDRRILRASDADRDAVIEKLRHHGAVGRLGVDELTERIEAALDAKTLGQLDDLLVDLPDDSPLSSMPPPSPPVAPYPERHAATVLRHGAQLLILNLALLGLWVSAGTHGLWPIWVVLISIVVFGRRRRNARHRRDGYHGHDGRTPPPYLGR